MYESSLLAVVQKQLHAAERILVVSHIRPDGDAVGSLLAFGLSLQAVGKETQMVLADGVPRNFNFLPASDQVRSKPERDFDFTVVLDCSDPRRIGGVLDGKPPPDLNIDHHFTNLNFARYNLVIVEAVATAEILVDIFPGLNLPINKPIAEALLTGLITDTLGFRTVNMTPKAMRTAALLMEAGADLPTLYQNALLKHSYSAARYWGAGLAKLNRDGRIIWTTLTLEDRALSGYYGRDDADLVNVLTTIEEADVVLIFVEQTSDRVKVSWRSKPQFDVSEIALRFGGGGHKSAAGAEIEGKMNEVQSKVLQATRVLFEC